MCRHIWILGMNVASFLIYLLCQNIVVDDVSSWSSSVIVFEFSACFLQSDIDTTYDTI